MRYGNFSIRKGVNKIFDQNWWERNEKLRIEWNESNFITRDFGVAKLKYHEIGPRDTWYTAWEVYTTCTLPESIHIYTGRPPPLFDHLQLQVPPITILEICYIFSLNSWRLDVYWQFWTPGTWGSFSLGYSSFAAPETSE